MVQYTGKSDDSMFDSGDAWGHFYITSRATQNWTWTINQDPDGCLNASAVEFKAAQSAATNTHDFNGDGKSDIAWRDTSGNVAIWEMNGTTVLNPNTADVGNVPTTWTIVGTGDFNGDGNWDILWRDTSGNIAIWEMNGTTVLNPNAAGVGNVATSFKIVGSGDFNGDGKSDVLWRDTSGTVAIWFMNGTSVLNPNAAGVGNVPIIWTIQDALGG